MPVYNGVALLADTLDSLAAQTFGDFEVIVVDDGSTDGTRAMVEAWPDPRVRLVTMPQNGGPVLARNRGVAEARGRYIAALDHDDLCRPERFARQVAYLDAHPATVLLGTGAAFLDDGAILASGHPPATTPMLIDWLTGIENPLVWSSVMLRTEAARRLAPFMRPERVYAEDFDLYQRIRRLGSLARLDAVLTLYRVHPGGISKQFADRMDDSAVAVLATRHEALFGPRAEAVARLLVRHVAARRAVPDRGTLVVLARALQAIESDFFATNACDADDQRLISQDTARRWRDIGRAGLRSGTLSVTDVLSVRPRRLGRGYRGAGALLWSGMIGRVRRAGINAQPR